MLYNYSQAALNAPGSPTDWSTFFDPALTGVMPAAALAYRQGHVSPAKTSYCLMLNPSSALRPRPGPSDVGDHSDADRTEQTDHRDAGLKELPWLKASQPSADTTVVTDPDHDFIPAGNPSFVPTPANCSVTGSTESR